MVEWQSLSFTGGSGISITSYTVTVDGDVSGTVSDDGNGLYTHTITGLDYNTDYSVEVVAVNECGPPSQPATITVSIEARGQPQFTDPCPTWPIIYYLYFSATSANSVSSFDIV